MKHCLFVCSLINNLTLSSSCCSAASHCTVTNNIHKGIWKTIISFCYNCQQLPYHSFRQHKFLSKQLQESFFSLNNARIYSSKKRDKGSLQFLINNCISSHCPVLNKVVQFYFLLLILICLPFILSFTIHLFSALTYMDY